MVLKADKLWVKWVNYVYEKESDWWNYIFKTDISWVWRKICNFRWIQYKDGIYTVKTGYEWLRFLF